MRTRTASFTVDYRTTELQSQPAFGYCTIVERQQDAYFRWSIDQEQPSIRHQLACRCSRVNYRSENLSDNPFEVVRPHIIATIHRCQQRLPARFRVLAWTWNPPPANLAVFQQILATLEHIHRRPSAYLGPPTVDALIHFLHGFQAGCAIAGYTTTRTPQSAYHTIVEARGWEFLAAPPVAEMRERGRNEQEIIDELLQIEIATWKATYNVE
jgi:hypothetical protein